MLGSNDKKPPKYNLHDLKRVQEVGEREGSERAARGYPSVILFGAAVGQAFIAMPTISSNCGILTLLRKQLTKRGRN